MPQEPTAGYTLMKELSIKGISLGVITDITCSTIAGMILLLTLGSDTPYDDTSMLEPYETIALGNEFLSVALIVGLFFTVLGGFVAAKVADEGLYLNSGMVGFIGVIFSIPYAGEYPLWFAIAGFALLIPAALLGGHLCKLDVGVDDENA